MATNDFMAEAAENYEQKCLCVLVLDTSGSMESKVNGKTLIAELNEGLQEFYDEISNDVSTAQKLEVSIIGFSHIVTTIQEPALVDNFTMPTLKAHGSTALADAVNEAIDKVDARKNWYKSTNQSYYRPWIILITDGEPDSDQDIDALAERIKEDMNNKRYAFLPMGVAGANMNILTQLAGSVNGQTMGPMKLSGTKFSSFFKWLSASMGAVVKSEEGDSVNFAGEGMDLSWMDHFTI